MVRWGLCCVLLLAACTKTDIVGIGADGTGSATGTSSVSATGSTSEGPGTTGSGETTATGTTGSGSTGAVTSSSGPGSTGAVGSTGGTAGSTGGIPGCTEVDVLLVVDSGLGQVQVVNDLEAAIPDLVAGLWDALPPGTSVHLGLTRSDFSDGMGCSRTVIDCVIQQTPAEIAMSYLTPDQQTTAKNGGQGRLLEHDGMRWVADTTDQPATVASQWLEGAVAALTNDCPMSMPSAALGWALDPVNAPTNFGFLRDQAVLGIVVVTEGPDATPEDAAAMVAKVNMAKAPCPGCITVAGMLGACVTATTEKLWEVLLTLDPTPAVGSVNAPQEFTTVLGQAFPAAVAETCAGIDPRG